MKRPYRKRPILSRRYWGTTSASTTAAIASADTFHTPNSATRTRPIPTQSTALIARRRFGLTRPQRSSVRPTVPSATHQDSATLPLISARLATFGRPFSEQALGPEDEDEDQDREHDRLRPVAPRHVPGEALVEGLDEADAQCAEHGAGEVADPAQDGRGEGDQPELEALVEPHLGEVEDVRQPRGPGEAAGDEERERDRPVDVDAHHRRRVLVLRSRAHRLPLACV